MAKRHRMVWGGGFAGAPAPLSCGGEVVFGWPLRQARDYPQIVRERAPADRELAMGKALGAQWLTQKVVQKDGNPRLRLGTAPLQLDEFPRAQALS